MSTHKLYHKKFTDIYLDTNDNYLYRDFSIASVLCEIFPANNNVTKIFRYKGKLLSYIRVMYECYNGIIITDKNDVCVYNHPYPIDPSKIENMPKSDWIKAKHDNGELKETMKKVSTYMSKHSTEWKSKAVLNIDLNETFASAQLASKAMGLSDMAVSHGIRYNHTVGGFHWKYKDPIEQKKVEDRRASLAPIKPTKYIRKKDRVR